MNYHVLSCEFFYVECNYSIFPTTILVFFSHFCFSHLILSYWSYLISSFLFFSNHLFSSRFISNPFFFTFISSCFTLPYLTLFYLSLYNYTSATCLMILLFSSSLFLLQLQIRIRYNATSPRRWSDFKNAVFGRMFLKFEKIGMSFLK